MKKKIKVIITIIGLLIIGIVIFQCYNYIDNKNLNLESSIKDKLYLDLGYASDANNFEGKFELASDNKVQELGTTTGMTEDVLLKNKDEISYSDSQRDYIYNQKTEKINSVVRKEKEQNEISQDFSGIVNGNKISLYNYGVMNSKGHTYENRLYYNYKGKNVQYKIFNKLTATAYLMNNTLYVISSNDGVLLSNILIIDKYNFINGKIKHKEILRKQLEGDSFGIGDSHIIKNNKIYMFLSSNKKIYILNFNIKTNQLSLQKTNINDAAEPDIIGMKENKAYYLTFDNNYKLGFLNLDNNKVESEKKISNDSMVPNCYHFDKGNNKLYTLEYWADDEGKVRLREVDILTGKSHLVKGLNRIELKGYSDMAILDFYYEKK